MGLLFSVDILGTINRTVTLCPLTRYHHLNIHENKSISPPTPSKTLIITTLYQLTLTTCPEINPINPYKNIAQYNKITTSQLQYLIS